MATPKLTKGKLEDVLTRRLRLKDPVFFLENVGDRVVGDIVSPTFKGKRDHERQEQIWQALEAELGVGFARRVGMLLAYTPDEWNLGAEDQVTVKKSKKAG